MLLRVVDAKTSREISEESMLRSLQLVDRSRIARDLAELGVSPGDTVMLHASVGAIGWIIGGPEQVLGAVTDVLGDGGTLMMYVGWEGSPYDIAVEATELPPALLEIWPAYDPSTSRAMHAWSVLTEYLRTSPGAQRSSHPDHSFAAVGANATDMTQDHPMQYSMGPQSPLAKLCDLGGKVLLLGAPLSSVTLLHHAEHLADIPGKQVVRYRAPILKDGIKTWVDIEEFSTTGCLPWRGSTDLFEAIVRDYIQEGHGSIGNVGAATSYLFDAASLVAFGVDWIETQFSNPVDEDLGVEIRPADPSDHRPLVALLRAMEQETSGVPYPESRASKRIDELLETSDQQVFIAVTEEDIVGMIVASVLSRERGVLDLAFVKPENRRQGILRELEMDASAYLRDSGCNDVEVRVSAQNGAARVAWRSLGYTPTVEFMERPL
jgi:aminoglycoside 3-N-acetyltransferase